MPYAMPLADRLRISRRERERYERDPDFRLKQINRTRQRRGMQPLPDLPERCGSRLRTDQRDERGRFA